MVRTFFIFLFAVAVFFVALFAFNQQPMPSKNGKANGKSRPTDKRGTTPDDCPNCPMPSN